jgi:hypothetical protein
MDLMHLTTRSIADEPMIWDIAKADRLVRELPGASIRRITERTVAWCDPL